MSKNTNISELINYLSYDGSGNIVFHSLSAASTNTDKFLVSDGSTLKHRTAAQLLSDIGAQASGSYQAALSGTGFVKISGSTISYDNSTYATETYVGTAISNLVASSPATLDTLNELALALGSDPNFATTVATSIGTKQAQLNGTGFVKVSGTTVSYDNSTYALDSAVVKLAGSQTITGVKTFTGAGNTFTQNTNFLDRIYLRSASTTDYTNLSGHTNQLLVGVIGATHILSFPENTNYTYTFPAASGTLALTSNLSSYLPLAGGTLSGRLNGIVGGTAYNTAGLWLQGSSSTDGIAIGGTGGGDKTIDTYGGTLRLNGTANNGLYVGGAATFSSSLTANSGVFEKTSATNGTSLIVRQTTAGGNGNQDIGLLVDIQGANDEDRIANFRYYDGSTFTSRMVIRRGGNVGIGILAPTATLQVRGPNAVGVFFDAQNEGAGGATFSRVNASSSPYNHYIFNNGSVGINTNDFSEIPGSSALKIAGARATLGLNSSGTISTIALVAGNNTATAMHMNFENTGAFRWYSYVSAGETFSLLGNGRLGLGVPSPDARLHVAGPILVSNGAQTYRRAITCHGATGTYSQVKVIFNKSAWGSVVYDIKLASAGASHHTAGGYYSNPGVGSHVNSINAGGLSMSFVSESQVGTQGQTWTFSGATMIHPIVTVDIGCGNGYQVNPDDIIVQFI